MPNSILFLRLYDIAESIDLSRAEACLTRLGGAVRVRLEKVPPKAMRFENPPLAVDAGTVEVEVNGEPREMSLRAKVYDLGVISMVGTLRMPDDATWDDWLRTVTRTDPVALESLFTERMGSVRDSLGPAARLHGRAPFVEDYSVLYFTSWDPEWDAVPLVLGATNEVSAMTRRDVANNTFAYGTRDLAVITWDRALVYDADGATDLLDLLELANTQLLELRFYDTLLSEAVARAHAEIQQAGKRASLRRLSNYRRIMKGLMGLTVEVTEIVEKVRNTLKVTEDVFYARVYGATGEILRTGVWMDSIRRKLDLLQRSYSMLSDELVTERGNLLEAAVLFLILLEFIVALLPYLAK